MMLQVHAIIQAGGLGLRIQAAAGTTPKPLLPVGGVPMIERLLCQVTAAGVNKVTVVLGPNGGCIREPVLRILSALPADVQLQFFVETTGLGNAGALGEIRTADDHVLLCFADLVTDISFAELVALHERRGCNITLTSHYEDHQLTLGELTVDGDAVRGYVEKPRKRYLICSGIALFDPKAMSVARQLPRPFGLSDVVNASLSAGCTVTHWLHQSYWIDVNTPELLVLARNDSNSRMEAPRKSTST